MAINTSEITEVQDELGELAAPAGTLRNYFSGTELLKLSDNGATSNVATKIGDTMRELTNIGNCVTDIVSAAEAINDVPYVD